MTMKMNLEKAQKNKKDEFYTRLEDIENELKHYKHHFRDKVVYCNCDDPRVSNFFHYFSYNFEHLGLKKLITTCYKNQEIDLFSENDSERAIYLEYNGEKNGGSIPTAENIGIHHLRGDGDFRSKETIELLKQVDIVVTNPPFSLFREYVNQLIDFDKKFIIVGHQNAITYKETFPLLKDNKMWLGFGFKGGAGHFINKDYENYATSSNQKEGMIRVSGVVWYTNLDISKRTEDIILYKKYSADEYPMYDNYNAINVDKTADIPMDYEGIMGVPITFFNRYNPYQFEILGINTSYSDDLNHIDARPIKKYKNAKQFSKNGDVSGGNKINDSSTILYKNKPDKTYYTVDDIEGYLTITYARIFIKNKKVVK